MTATVQEKGPGLDGIHYTGDKGPFFGARHVQLILSALAMGIMMSTKSMFSVLIVAMVKEGSSVNPDVPYYDWNNVNVIISSILWSGLFFQSFSGHMGKEYGPKWFVAGALALNAISFSLIPLAASLAGSTGVICCRLAQGAAQGIFMPMTACVHGTWIPTEERARLGFIGTCGVTFSLMISSIVAGTVSKSSLGWPWGFYMFGILNLAYVLVWILFAHQSAETHPYISPEEKRYIQTSLSQRPGTNLPTPWLKILLNIHVWAIIVAMIGGSFIMTFVQSEKSIFLDKIMKFDIQANGIVGSIPTLCGAFSGVIFAFLSDYTVKSKIMPTVNSRRIFHVIGSISNALCLVSLTFVPSDKAAIAVVILCFESIFMIACIAGGSTINVYDISPKFAGIIVGIASTIGDAFALFAPLLAQWCITDQDDVEQWRLAFSITAGIAIVGAIFFGVFATDKRQEWNEPTIDYKVDRRFSAMSIEGSLNKF
ncbi:putative inorganic phosphate cotransporter [Rhynchophorus ferrugineus]|uniref:putative inorganic phosphate cotransporter n=1 Tax=Rhynchophorus ferrugineus TaxID=354439 RepID=UPI003FCDA1BC